MSFKDCTYKPFFTQMTYTYGVDLTDQEMIRIKQYDICISNICTWVFINRHVCMGLYQISKNPMYECVNQCFLWENSNPKFQAFHHFKTSGFLAL